MQIKADIGYMQRVTLIILFALITLSFFYSPGTGDVKIWIKWIKVVDASGPFEGFKAIQWDYPPLVAVIMFLIAKTAHIFSIDFFTALKLALALFLAVTSLIFWIWTRNPLITAIAHFSLLWNSLMLGYIDIFFAPFLVLSLWALKESKMATFTIFYSIACLIKWQPIIIAPFILLYILNISKISELKKIDYKTLMLNVLLPISIITIITIALFKTPFLMSFASAVNELYLSGDALNFGWIFTYLIRVFYPESFGPLIEGQATYIITRTLKVTIIPKILFFIFYATTFLSFFKREKGFESLIHYSLLGFLAYFTFNTGVHENHLFVPAVLAVILFFLNREHLVTSAYILIMSNINLIIFFGIDGMELKFSRVIGIDITLLLSLLNVVFFLLIWYAECLQRKRAEVVA